MKLPAHRYTAVSLVEQREFINEEKHFDTWIQKARALVFRDLISNENRAHLFVGGGGDNVYCQLEVDRECIYITLGMGGPSILAGIVDVRGQPLELFQGKTHALG